MNFRRRVSGPLSFLLLLSALLAAGWTGGCTGLKRFFYEGFGREEWQRPAQVIEALQLAPGARVVDLGAGGGYFTFRLARAVGESGRVYAVDIDPGMITYLEKRARKEELPQVVPVLAEPADPQIPEAEIDLIFISNTFHHLEDRAAYFARLRPLLDPDGRVAVIEVAKGGFPPGHVTPPEQIRSELEDAGYRRVQEFDFLPRQSFQLFAANRQQALRAADSPSP